MSGAPDPPVFLGMPRPEPVADARWRLGNATRGGLVARDVRFLRTRWQRFRAAWGRRLQPEQGLFLAPAPAVHAFGARQDLLVLYLDERDRVLRVQRLARWRAAAAPPGTAAALLLGAERAAPAAEGDQLEWLAPQPRLPGRADWLGERGYPAGE